MPVSARAADPWLHLAPDRSRVFVTTTDYDPGVLGLTGRDLAEFLKALACPSGSGAEAGGGG